MRHLTPTPDKDPINTQVARGCLHVAALRLKINLVGAMFCLQEAGRIRGAQKSGSIINMSSLMGIQGYPMRSAYVASKFALIGITETMARELGPLNIRVNALMPGAVSGENMDRILACRAEAEGRCT